MISINIFDDDTIVYNGRAFVPKEGQPPAPGPVPTPTPTPTPGPVDPDVVVLDMTTGNNYKTTGFGATPKIFCLTGLQNGMRRLISIAERPGTITADRGVKVSNANGVVCLDWQNSGSAPVLGIRVDDSKPIGWDSDALNVHSEEQYLQVTNWMPQGYSTADIIVNWQAF